MTNVVYAAILVMIGCPQFDNIELVPLCRRTGRKTGRA